LFLDTSEEIEFLQEMSLNPTGKVDWEALSCTGKINALLCQTDMYCGTDELLITIPTDVRTGLFCVSGNGGQGALVGSGMSRIELGNGLEVACFG